MQDLEVQLADSQQRTTELVAELDSRVTSATTEVEELKSEQRRCASRIETADAAMAVERQRADRLQRLLRDQAHDAATMHALLGDASGAKAVTKQAELPRQSPGAAATAPAQRNFGTREPLTCSSFRARAIPPAPVEALPARGAPGLAATSTFTDEPRGGQRRSRSPRAASDNASTRVSASDWGLLSASQTCSAPSSQAQARLARGARAALGPPAAASQAAAVPQGKGPRSDAPALRAEIGSLDQELEALQRILSAAGSTSSGVSSSLHGTGRRGQRQL